MTEPNDPAFPVESVTLMDRRGLTKREYFAAMALQGLLANEKYLDKSHVDDIMMDAVNFADYLIIELNNRPNP